MIELLVVIGIVGLLLGLLFPTMRTVRRSGDLARELSAARQLMVAYRSYAYDHRGVLMPGYYYLNGTLPAFDKAGDPIEGIGVDGAGYPWRLAPYLDYDLQGLYLDKRLVREFTNNEGRYYTYLVGVLPSLGINGTFVGGDTRSFAFQDQYTQLYGKFYATRLSEVKRPTDLIVFASARTNDAQTTAFVPGRDLVEGHFCVLPPYQVGDDERDWADRYDPECADPCSTADWGHVSLRHAFREAAIGFFDGHAGTLDETEIQDMRHWADRADAPDWSVRPP